MVCDRFQQSLQPHLAGGLPLDAKRIERTNLYRFMFQGLRLTVQPWPEKRHWIVERIQELDSGVPRQSDAGHTS